MWRVLAWGVGSSPLTRGKRREDEARPLQGGLIPAHAGKTTAAPTRWVVVQAHPRSRGENGCVQIPTLNRCGSSPLTRGKRDVATAAAGGRGLIPAHAGKTTARKSSGSRSRAHPRSRGENDHLVGHGGRVQGSSPLTRGKPLINRAPFPLIGLIPAHAGKTGKTIPGPTPDQAHPRSRGENQGHMRKYQ